MSGAEAIAIAVTKSICILSMTVNAMGEAYIFAEAIKAVGRNPKLEETIFTKVIIAAAVVESTAIYSLVAFFTL